MNNNTEGNNINDVNISVLIPTYHRPNDLQSCLDSLLQQALKPLEVIIIDNGSDDITEKLIRTLYEDFAGQQIELRYVQNNSLNSLTVARNLGFRESRGNIILFLDDDVILDPSYIQEIARVYQTHPHALGVQGYIDAEPSRPFPEFFYKLFFWGRREARHCRVMPSVSATFPKNLDEITHCQCLSGANHSWRRSVLDEFQYDENLVKYSDGEDLELSYRVYKKYPGALFITPFANLVHRSSPEGRTPGKQLIFMREIYGLYLFFKLFNPTLPNIGIFIWSRIGRILFSLYRATVKGQKNALTEAYHLFGAYISCVVHIRSIRRGNLDFFNKQIL